jgi:hypothetical protein
MNVRRRNRSMAGRDRDLMQIRDNIADGVQSGYARLLMRIDLQASRFVVARAERLTQVGTHITAQDWSALTFRSYSRRQ